jgi:hypothetical protein
MSNPKAPIKLKLTGDTHLPDAESDLDVEEGTSTLAQLAQPRDQGGRPQVRRAGVLVAPEDDTRTDATAGARDASTSRRTLSRGDGTRDDAPGEDATRGTLHLKRPQARPAGTRQAQPRAGSGDYRIWLVPLAAAALLVRLLR